MAWTVKKIEMLSVFLSRSTAISNVDSLLAWRAHHSLDASTLRQPTGEVQGRSDCQGVGANRVYLEVFAAAAAPVAYLDGGGGVVDRRARLGKPIRKNSMLCVCVCVP